MVKFFHEKSTMGPFIKDKLREEDLLAPRYVCTKLKEGAHKFAQISKRERPRFAHNCPKTHSLKNELMQPYIWHHT